jgi:hypothetical protein
MNMQSGAMIPNITRTLITNSWLTVNVATLVDATQQAECQSLHGFVLRAQTARQRAACADDMRDAEPDVMCGDVCSG